MFQFMPGCTCPRCIQFRYDNNLEVPADVKKAPRRRARTRVNPKKFTTRTGRLFT
jgi:hypothetical protein